MPMKHQISVITIFIHFKNQVEEVMIVKNKISNTQIDA